MSEWRQRLDDEWDQFVVKIKTHKTYQEAEQKYLSLPDRDRMWVNILTIVTVVFLLYQIVVSPALTYLSSASKSYQKQLENHEWIATKEAETRSLLEAKTSGRDGSLLSVASSTAKTHELTFSRFEPIGDDRVRLWLEQAKFNSIVDWLGELETDQGISAVDISLDSSTPGYVSVRLTLQG